MRFGAIANSARGGPQRPPPMGDRVNKNPKIYESIIRIGDWSQPYDFSKQHDASIS